ncbi:MAG: hypothetical protein HUN04_15105 [Desulfobacter sp.]|nr:MAG: hypothetical protein HUN04_15105 [Desulfobacter sp.]
MTSASIKSLGSGIGGAVILTLFATTFLTIEKALVIIPLFLGFTGAMIGFALVDQLRDRIRGRFIFPFIMGAGQGAAVFAIANTALPFAGRVMMLSAVDLLIYIVVSGITSYLGARLAARYFNL